MTISSNREEELARLREELGKKGLEMLEDSELQQKESALAGCSASPLGNALACERGRSCPEIRMRRF